MSNGFGAGGSGGSGQGGFGAAGFGPGDYQKLVREYWNNWGEMMRKAAASAPSGLPGMTGMPPGIGSMPGMPGFDEGDAAKIPGWNEALAWWSDVAKSGAGGGADTGFKDAVDQFNAQARSWFELMQQVAAQAQPGASPADIAQAWQRALGGLGDNPFADMFRTMRGPGQQGFDSWLEQAAPYMQGFAPWQGEGQSLLGQPTFGFTREHQQRWQQLMQAQIDYQRHSHAYNALMAEAAHNAFKLFETKLHERSEPGRQLESARALFDLWIEAAEEAYAEIALSPRFREAYGSMVNSQMRLRGGLQREVEEACELFGIPTRTEVDSSHRKLVQVERELRRIRDALEAIGGLDELAARAGGSIEPRRRSAAAKPAAKQPVAKKATAKKATAKPAVAKKATAKKATAKKTAAKKTAANKTTAKKATAKKSTAKKSTAKKSTAKKAT
ncbi:MAG TPA: class III poly(R)-hydroxyalkanoic acid synthase subunit PhaE, partial [Lysobacter sp.]|nr:class III poly(R)-hydroxyalkanoic acid synthase subunit PhaE [Lysobacter sp.]